MVANHHGRGSDLAELRARFGLSLKGANLGRLVEIAREMGLLARPLRLELSELARLRTPCVLHWDLNHFVVLARVRGRKLRLLDPAVGERELDLDALSPHFTGVALELSPGPGFCTRPPPPPLRWSQLPGRGHGLVASLGLLLGLSLLLQLLVILGPFYLQWVIDQALLAGDRDLLLLLALGFALLLALQVGTGLLRGWAVLQLSSRLGLQWLGNVFSHLLRLPMAYFERRMLGDVVSRLGAVQAIQRTLTLGAVEAVVDGAMALAALGMMLAYSPWLAGISLVCVLLYLAARLAAHAPFRQASEAQLLAGARQQGHLLESLRGMQSLKLSGRPGHRSAAYANLLAATSDAELRVGRYGLAFATAAQALFGAERLLVVWLAATLVLDGRFSVGMLVAYLAYKDQFSARVSGLVDRVMEFRMLRLHGERLADVVLSAPEPAEDAPAAGLPDEGEGLVLRDVGYRYSEAEPWVLRHCSLRIAPGESVAIVGPSGCGKTTLLKLMLGLLPPVEGELSVGGLALGRDGRRPHREWVAAVMQDDHLFAGSLADNIALGEFDPDPARVEAAARLAAVHEDIVAMPMGYHSLVGDMGSSLSGGQRQRVILARALYRQPRFLFLDEATSHLDLACERSVNAAIAQLRITRVIIAHRPQTIASADRVIVLDRGAVVADSRNAPARGARLSREAAPCPG
jgi:ATP-binding cassette subfamily B protein RaxB